MKMLIIQLKTWPLDQNENDRLVHLIKRTERLAAELQRLNMELPSGFVLNLSILVLPKVYDALSQDSGG